MKKSVRTIYGALIDTCNRFREELPILPNSTLNQKFGVFEGELPREGEMPATKYFAIGLKGQHITMDTDGLFKTTYRQYSPRQGSLFGHIPFIMREINRDLTAPERLPYRLRRIEEHKGKVYACYYLKKTDDVDGPAGVEYRTVQSGNVIPSKWEPTLVDLNPPLTNVNPNQVIQTGDDYLSAIKKIRLVFSPNDIQEILNVVNIIHGDPDKANITEVAMVSAIDRVVTGDFNGVSANYTEAIYAQCTDYVKTTISAPNALKGQVVYVDAGSNEPLLTPTNPNGIVAI